MASRNFFHLPRSCTCRRRRCVPDADEDVGLAAVVVQQDEPDLFLAEFGGKGRPRSRALREWRRTRRRPRTRRLRAGIRGVHGLPWAVAPASEVGASGGPSTQRRLDGA
jgi:hypothetical protein